MTRQIRSVLVANRGEIAVRVIRTLRDMGIRSIAVYSDADADAPHVRAADDAVRIGPAPSRESYLDIDAVIGAARVTGADAIHPGYGFLSENAAFVRACSAADIVFIGPSTEAIAVMGDKITAKATVTGHGVPVVPGISRPGLTDDDLVAAAPEIGFPVLVKPSAGGGGKGMRVVDNAEDLPAALAGARREAAASFGDDTLFLERFVHRPRHIEVQVLADEHGTVIHLGERECSLQRRHQKVIEEAPSPLLDEATRARIGEAACATARSVGYTGAGTVEFIVSADAPDEFFFMEMNTRLQVEHPVTEMVTGVDLVAWQVRVARGEPLALAQDDIRLAGHAIEARVYAEDPAAGFVPTGGTVAQARFASGVGVRVDAGIADGTVVGGNYDPMLAKVIAHADTRDEAIARLDGALADTALLGIGTNVDFLRFLLADADVRAGRLDTALLDSVAAGYEPTVVPDDVLVALAAVDAAAGWDASDDPWSRSDGWRLNGPASAQTVRLGSGDTVHTVATRGEPSALAVVVDGEEHRATVGSATGSHAIVTVDARRREYALAVDGTVTWVSSPGGTWAVHRVDEERSTTTSAAAGDTDVRSPMPGSVIALPVDAGSTVSAGAVVAVVEAMKMEHSLTAAVDGVVDVVVSVGDQVKVGDVLVHVRPEGEQT
ncbi:acetyl-CoA carboxylase biotin carboxylase subunit [Williamsia serinedens]|uniref:biotin carboxylase n=1 Tax=Williamsia serinedens TaxID=391736 RepID=A0ABT1H558_9NOCA|nr:acetyl-CoA carboxylase biotin carboxylase subunit [Williamsia serinedens]MCP2162381.1 acetyl-CoA/propionyl-CoA carboxylase, biotin carboxylase, biotin carboxyl carrier protein [Williamsia serinedens]